MKISYLKDNAKNQTSWISRMLRVDARQAINPPSSYLHLALKIDEDLILLHSDVEAESTSQMKITMHKTSQGQAQKQRDS
ncbi:hypothetical protein D3C75_1110000 [compost metagenome]